MSTTTTTTSPKSPRSSDVVVVIKPPPDGFSQWTPSTSQLDQAISDDLFKKLSCPVCWEILPEGQIRITSCGHLICTACTDNIWKLVASSSSSSSSPSSPSSISSISSPSTHLSESDAGGAGAGAGGSERRSKRQPTPYVFRACPVCRQLASKPIHIFNDFSSLFAVTTLCCESVMYLRDVPNHLCSTTVQCLLCHELCQRNKTEDHLANQCSKRLVRCSLCQSMVVQEDINSHLEMACPNSFTTCPVSGCTESWERCKLEIHLTTSHDVVAIAKQLQESQRKVKQYESFMGDTTAESANEYLGNVVQDWCSCVGLDEEILEEMFLDQSGVAQLFYMLRDVIRVCKKTMHRWVETEINLDIARTRLTTESLKVQNIRRSLLTIARDFSSCHVPATATRPVYSTHIQRTGCRLLEHANSCEGRVMTELEKGVHLSSRGGEAVVTFPPTRIVGLRVQLEDSTRLCHCPQVTCSCARCQLCHYLGLPSLVLIRNNQRQRTTHAVHVPFRLGSSSSCVDLIPNPGEVSTAVF